MSTERQKLFEVIEHCAFRWRFLVAAETQAEAKKIASCLAHYKPMEIEALNCTVIEISRDPRSADNAGELNL